MAMRSSLESYNETIRAYNYMRKGMTERISNVNGADQLCWRQNAFEIVTHDVSDFGAVRMH
jgi:hypothetical protein